jgi:hypothetical protein
MSKTIVDRRAMLRGSVGGLAAAIGLPPLEAMFNDTGTAYAADGKPIPKRFGMWWWAQGIGSYPPGQAGSQVNQWFPKTVSPKPWTQGARTVGTYDDDWQPSPELGPFVAKGLRKDISIVTGARLFGWSETMHDSQMIGMTTGWPVTQGCGTFCVRPSHKPLPQELSDRWRASGGRFPILAVTAGSGNVSGVTSEKSPAALFDRVFAGATSVRTGVTPRFSTASRRSVLDLVAAEAASLKVRVGAIDRARIDAHLQSLRDLEARLRTAPAAPTGGTVTLTRPSDGAANDYTGRHDAFARMLALALATGQTRVFCVTMDSGQSGVVYSHIPGVKLGHHALTHTSGMTDLHHQIVTWKMERLATLISYLKEIPEGDGTLLDSCLVFAATEMDNPFNHYSIHQPMLLAGKAGGTFRTGRYYSAFYGGGQTSPYSYGGGPTGSTNQESSTKILLTILRALGEPDTEYGGDGTSNNGGSRNYGRVTEPFGALLA